MIRVMQIWLDTIDVSTIRHAHSLKLLKGITTNPILLADAAESVFNDLLSQQEGPPVAIQLTERTRDKMLQQAHQINKASSRFIIKVPACQEGYFFIEELEDFFQLIKGSIEFVYKAAQYHLEA